MSSWAGKLFKSVLNLCTVKYPSGSASPLNTGFKALINGTQQQIPGGIRFQEGIKHAIVKKGYGKSLNEFHNLYTSHNSTGKELLAVRNRVPRTFHQPMRELSYLMSNGVRI